MAQGLAAAGDEVHIWASAANGVTPTETGVIVHRSSGSFSRLVLAQIDTALAELPGRILLQYTPHAFGYKAMNVPLCAWSVARGRPLDVMFHEVAFPSTPGQPFKHKFLARVQCIMASLLLRGAAARVYLRAGLRGAFANTGVELPGTGLVAGAEQPAHPGGRDSNHGIACRSAHSADLSDCGALRHLWSLDRRDARIVAARPAGE